MKCGVCGRFSGGLSDDGFQLCVERSVALNVLTGPNPIDLAESFDRERVVLLNSSGQVDSFERGYESPTAGSSRSWSRFSGRSIPGDSHPGCASVW
jgi:hypothetical protein